MESFFAVIHSISYCQPIFQCTCESPINAETKVEMTLTYIVNFWGTKRILRSNDLNATQLGNAHFE